MSGPLQWPLFTGPLPVTLLASGAAGAAFLIFRRRRRWLISVLPLITGGSALATLLIAWVVNALWRPFPDPLPAAVFVWVAVILGAMALGVAHFRSARWLRRVTATIAVVAVLAAGANQINRFFGYYPTPAALLGLPLPQERPLPAIQRAGVHLGHRPPSSVLAQTWRPPVGMPTVGAVSHVAVPGVRSGFRARPAWLYLPPAYLTDSRPNLPVLMLIVGQPGTSRDWIDAGHVITIMDLFAAAHHGLAPIVVMPDPLGSTMANPLCANTSLGNVDTYLAEDVPTWVSANLQVDPDTRHWAVGGFSYGGTCSLQLSVNHPRLFPTFLDISGQDAPTLGSRQRTLDRAFGGDARAFAHINPLDILSTLPRNRLNPMGRSDFSTVAGTLAVGSRDAVFASQQHHVQAVAVKAGMSIGWLEVPGGHSWHVAVAALRQALPWLSTRMGLTR